MAPWASLAHALAASGAASEPLHVPGTTRFPACTRWSWADGLQALVDLAGCAEVQVGGAERRRGGGRDGRTCAITQRVRLPAAQVMTSSTDEYRGDFANRVFEDMTLRELVARGKARITKLEELASTLGSLQPC